jgi:acetate kinase
MRILVINTGSTSLRFEVIASRSEWGGATLERGAEGHIAGIGGATLFTATIDGASQRVPCPNLSDHGSATAIAFEWLHANGVLNAAVVDALALRIVHGGARLVEPVLIDERVLREVEALNDLAPLHNGPAVEALKSAQQLLPSVPMVAVFDTAYFHDLPSVARIYAIPQDTSAQHGIRRYGFHGIAHRCMAARASDLLGCAASRRLITLQLGGGCSAAAIVDGRPVDTTMGLTPLEGLMMGTRCGDIDPNIIGLLMRKESMTVRQAERWLNERCGMLGVSGVSGDVRELLSLAAAGHSDAALAIEMFCTRIRKCIAAYMAVLGGADAIIFGGGIGEHSAEVRSRVCHGLEWCGVELSNSANRGNDGCEQYISSESSKVAVCVVRVNEAQLIAADASECLRRLGYFANDSHSKNGRTCE